MFKKILAITSICSIMVAGFVMAQPENSISNTFSVTGLCLHVDPSSQDWGEVESDNSYDTLSGAGFTYTNCSVGVPTINISMKATQPEGDDGITFLGLGGGTLGVDEIGFESQFEDVGSFGAYFTTTWLAGAGTTGVSDTTHADFRVRTGQISVIQVYNWEVGALAVAP